MDDVMLLELFQIAYCLVQSESDGGNMSFVEVKLTSPIEEILLIMCARDNG